MTEPSIFAYSVAHSEHERMCVVMTNECFSSSLYEQPFRVTLCSKYTSTKGHVKKNALERVNCNNGQKSKQLYASPIKREQGFVVPFWILPKYPLPFPLDKGNAGPWNEIVKTQYVLISLLLVLIELLHGQVPNSWNLSPL